MSPISAIRRLEIEPLQWYHRCAMIQHLKQVLGGALLLGIASGNPLVAQAAPSANPPVQIYFTVTGKGVAPPSPVLSQLTASIDKQPAQATSLRSAASDKMLFALLVDISGSSRDAAPEIKEAALSLFQALVAVGNEGHLVLFNTEIQMSERTVQLFEVQRKLDNVEFDGATALFDAIGDTCTKILGRSSNPDSPRRAIFLISDGADNRSHIGSKKAQEIAEEEGVVIFPLVIKIDPDPPIPEGRLAPLVALDLAHSTGGEAFIPEGLLQGIVPLIYAVHQQWVLGLAPSQALDQKLHPFTIKSTQKDLKISAPAKIFLP